MGKYRFQTTGDHIDFSIFFICPLRLPYTIHVKVFILGSLWVFPVDCVSSFLRTFTMDTHLELWTHSWVTYFFISSRKIFLPVQINIYIGETPWRYIIFEVLPSVKKKWQNKEFHRLVDLDKDRVTPTSYLYVTYLSFVSLPTSWPFYSNLPSFNILVRFVVSLRSL